MWTIVIFIVIVLAAGYALRSMVKGKGACGDCNCQCEIKERMKK